MTLSILCVTQLEPHAMRFLARMRELTHHLGAEFVIAVDGKTPTIFPHADRICVVHSKGFIESVLDEAIGACRGRYVLRLDDDEAASLAMERWLAGGQFLSAEHWTFPRAHLWPDEQSMIVTPPLWPDNQTRLSVKEKAGGRGEHPHQMSPYGMGDVAPVTIEHHKFLVRSYAERQETSRKWHSGVLCGIDMRVFSLPEDVHETLDVVEAGDGFTGWSPAWRKSILTRRNSDAVA